MRGTWDADIVEEIKPAPADHVVVKRRDSAFQDTEIGVWLKSLGVDTIVFCGIDTSICVEASLRDAFNNGYDVILISDATASGSPKHFESTLEIVKGLLWPGNGHCRIWQVPAGKRQGQASK